MFRKSFLFIIFAVVFSLSVHVTANAQLAPLNGFVFLEKDGKSEPVANAVVEVFRVDVKGFHNSKTDKKGEFRFVGIPYGEYVISVSAPNCSPALLSKIRAGREGLKIVMYPGDGRKYTEAEAKKGAAESSEDEKSGPSEDEKREQAELEKKNAEITAKNEKMKNADAVAIKSNSEGKAALDAKNYDLAITKYSEGIEAVPDYVGITPILIAGKMEALRFKGFDLYRLGAASADPEARLAKYKEANQSYDSALAAFQQAMSVLKAASATTDAAEQKKRETVTLGLYSSAAEIHRLKAITGIDASKIAEASTVYSEYIAMLTDPAKKIDAQMSLGEMMRRTGDFEKAVEAYKQVLVLKPDHADATGQLGLSLFGLGSGLGDKEKEQEGLNYMQKYIDMAPISPSDPPQTAELKKSIKDAVDYLKKEQKMAPQKVPSTPKKKN